MTTGSGAPPVDRTPRVRERLAETRARLILRVNLAAEAFPNVLIVEDAAELDRLRLEFEDAAAATEAAAQAVFAAFERSEEDLTPKAALAANEALDLANVAFDASILHLTDLGERYGRTAVAFAQRRGAVEETRLLAELERCAPLHAALDRVRAVLSSLA